MKKYFLNHKTLVLSVLALTIVLLLSSCGELVSRDDLGEIYGGTAVVDGEKIWLGAEFDSFKLYAPELTSVSDQTAYRKEISGKTLFYVNAGKIKNFPLVYDSASTLYGADYKVKKRYEWGEAKIFDDSYLDSFVSKNTFGGGTVKYVSELGGVIAEFADEMKNRGLTDMLTAKDRAKALYDAEHGQKRDLVVHTAPGYYCYTVCADFEVYAVFSYDPVRDAAEYTYVFLPVESSVSAIYARGNSEDFISRTGDHQLITLDTYRLRQLLPELFGQTSSDVTTDGNVTDGDAPNDSPTDDGKVVATYTFTDDTERTIDDAGYFGLGLGSVRDLLELSEYTQYMNGEYEFKITVESKFEFDKFTLIPMPCTREYCLYDRMPPPDGITGIVEESTARDEYGMLVCEKVNSTTVTDDTDSFTWTLDADKVTENMYLVYNAVSTMGNDPAWILHSITVRVDIVKK